MRLCHWTLQDTHYIRPHYQNRGVTAALPNTWKQTQGGCQNEKTKKYGPNERKKTPENELNETGTRNLSDAEIKKLVIRMLKELRISTA